MGQRLVHEAFRLSVLRPLQCPLNLTQLLKLLFDGQIIVGDVIAQSTERVGGVDGATSWAGQRDESVVEVLGFRLGNPLAVCVGLCGDWGCHDGFSVSLSDGWWSVPNYIWRVTFMPI